jgi:hypothetical protein
MNESETETALIFSWKVDDGLKGLPSGATFLSMLASYCICRYPAVRFTLTGQLIIYRSI